jgi:hypothetical protein
MPEQVSLHCPVIELAKATRDLRWTVWVRGVKNFAILVQCVNVRLRIASPPYLEITLLAIEPALLSLTRSAVKPRQDC